ncbi:hypothetical protein [Salinispira pacifica]|uniref:YD repeat protein n=1 Tax=Salinispira pacifica TaxID=1307761 RepID=V5WGF5_9SPIO|nr:hypothetical protein [Salinispira pacifica]AHC14868.1 YD repeat protein [Salinispira pacifica]
MFSATTDIDVSDLRFSLHIYLGENRIATRLKMEDSFDYDTVYEQYNTYYYHSDHPGCMAEQQCKAL